MISGRSFGFGLLLGISSLATFAFAQAHEAPHSVNCPVVVTARYVPSAALRPVQPSLGGVEKKPLHITFGPNDPKQELRILHAQVTVRGISEKGGVIPVTVVPSPWIQKTFTVDVTRNAAGLLASTLWLTGFGGVNDVRVDSITYDGGTVWNASERESCHAGTGTILTSSK